MKQNIEDFNNNSQPDGIQKKCLYIEFSINH